MLQVDFNFSSIKLVLVWKALMSDKGGAISTTLIFVIVFMRIFLPRTPYPPEVTCFVLRLLFVVRPELPRP